MPSVDTTKMSSKGQIVIPDAIRSRLGLKSGDRFLVLGDKDVVILKTLSSPSIAQFDALIRKARRQARAAGLKRSDVAKAVADSRRKK